MAVTAPIRFAVLALLAPLAVTAANPDCAGCHPAEAKLHAVSAHNSALMAPGDSAFAAHLPRKPLAEAANGFFFEYTRTPAGGLDTTIARGGGSAADRLTAPILWIFGSGRQGQTPMVRYQGRFIEHRVSLYTATGYGITIGQENGVSASAEKALGWAQTDQEAHTCFNCHATGVSADFASLTPGVQCVRCHAGAEAHARGGGVPVNPGKLDHLAQVQLCGTCHRLKPPSGNDADIANVRFQPLRLMKSACFAKSAIACTTCHPAHRNAQRDDPDGYNRKCLDCHANQTAHVAQQKSGDCIQCHMPKVSPAPALTFTDHFIRVVSAKP